MGKGSDTPLIDAARARIMGWRTEAATVRAPGAVERAGAVGEPSTPPTTSVDGLSGLMGGGAAGAASSALVEAPPISPDLLTALVDESAALATMIGIVATNVSGLGWEPLPLFRQRDAEGRTLEAPAGSEAERERLEDWMAAASSEGCLAELAKVDQDVETIGWGVLEVLRYQGTGGGVGDLAGFAHVRARHVRLCALSEPLQWDQKVRSASGQTRTIRRTSRFRVLKIEGAPNPSYLKQYGDPRRIGRYTGEVLAEGATGEEAPEAFWISIYSSSSAYGLPRWFAGSAADRLGREAEDLGLAWFLGAPIGSKVAAIAGGTWGAGAEELTGKVDAGRGSRKAFALHTLEAASAEGLDEKPERPAIQVFDLSSPFPEGLVHGDGNLVDLTFARAARIWRIPPIYWGGSSDYTRSTAETARATTEEQVFIPLRTHRWGPVFAALVAELGINWWAVGLKGARLSDPDAMAAATKSVGEVGGLSVNQAILLANRLTGATAATVSEAWAEKPLQLVLALLTAGIDPNLEIGAAMAAAAEAKAAEAAAQAEALAARQRAGGAAPGADPAEDPAQNGKPPGGRVAKADAPLPELIRAIAGEIGAVAAKSEHARIVPAGLPEALADVGARLVAVAAEIERGGDRWA
jgi:capsid portal protein